MTYIWEKDPTSRHARWSLFDCPRGTIGRWPSGSCYKLSTGWEAAHYNGNSHLTSIRGAKSSKAAMAGLLRNMEEAGL